MPINVLSLDGLVSRLIVFVLRDFDYNVPKIENAFKSSLTIGRLKKDKCSKDWSDCDSNEKDDEDHIFMATCFSTKSSLECWLIDSDCTNHLT